MFHNLRVIHNFPFRTIAEKEVSRSNLLRRHNTVKPVKTESQETEEIFRLKQ